MQYKYQNKIMQIKSKLHSQANTKIRIKLIIQTQINICMYIYMKEIQSLHLQLQTESMFNLMADYVDCQQ